VIDFDSLFSRDAVVGKLISSFKQLNYSLFLVLLIEQVKEAKTLLYDIVG